MELRTVVWPLSGSVVRSTWHDYTDAEFDNIRFAIKRSLCDPTSVYTFLEDDDPPSVEREIHIPVRNIDTITIETTSDDSLTAGS